MSIVVSDLEPVYLRTREDEQVRERDRHSRRPATIRKSNRPLPDISRNLVVAEQRFIPAERFPLNVIGHAAPELEPHRWTPGRFAVLQQRVHAIALRGVTALAKLMNPQ